MQALSHYSYHASSGQVLLCDLQGGPETDGSFTLTDPVILSKANTGEYGPTDLGPEGVSTFFGRHECNSYCNPKWYQPANQNVYFVKQEGSAMTAMNGGMGKLVLTPGVAKRMPAFAEEDDN